MALSINFYDQYLLITGGTRGIGAAVAQEAIESGGHVVITGTASEPPAWLAECQQRFPAQQLGYEQLDLAADDWLARVDAIVAAYPAFSVLINNAGITRPSDIRDEELTEFAKVIQVNLTAPAMLSARVALGMTAQCYGRIVNISSVLGITSIKGRAAYSSTKTGIIGQTRSCALDFAPDGILINAVCPGFVATDMPRATLGEAGLQKLAQERIPLGRVAEPADLVAPILFLASSLNTYITGQTLVVDGGYVIW
ncbi:MAG: SDR family oxidoreductase [Chloroflexaceae bacterium]|nr:SDR family oxidoreductase [Chloroflexaceae bacterium]NJO04459.1 SDR family oxidoreductase [Chloroflexaceae bacterium]